MHVTIGVYKNGQYKYNIVRDEDLDNHITYNKNYRPGRALFVDGKCIYKGNLSNKEISEWENDLIPKMCFDMSKPTIPYR